MPSLAAFPPSPSITVLGGFTDPHFTTVALPIVVFKMCTTTTQVRAVWDSKLLSSFVVHLSSHTRTYQG
ncbi:hypothetical protein SCP_0606130 [Sparassis crispa]|uniref:Uncharacterized protein n=1 Tax=Sparassis crispa TaxID=139825 RepID=A0A401GSC2_9APHY|nr:hypothetical protein SCP_0606130 [Sparassis crispa]GBE84634.1 hypothetical protein SCP_0606130 [Sparassis crispa]